MLLTDIMVEGWLVYFSVIFMIYFLFVIVILSIFYNSVILHEISASFGVGVRDCNVYSLFIVTLTALY